MRFTTVRVSEMVPEMFEEMVTVMVRACRPEDVVVTSRGMSFVVAGFGAEGFQGVCVTVMFG